MQNLFNKLLFLLIINSSIIISQSPLNDPSELIKASESGDLEKVKELIKDGVDVDNLDENGNTPLRKSSFNGHLEIVQELIKAGADVDKSKGGSGPLLLASCRGYLEIVKELIKAGADVDKSLGRISPLTTASFKGHLEIVKELVKAGANLDLENSNGDDALAIAEKRGKYNVKDFLARMKDIEENIANQIYPEVYPKDLSEEERIIFAKRLINQHKDNLYPLVFEILDTLSDKQLKSVFTEREIRNLIKAYKNEQNYNLGYTKNIINLAKKHTTDNFQHLISRLEEEQQRQAHKKDVFADMFVITQD